MANGKQDPIDFPSFLERTRTSNYRDLQALESTKVAEEAELETMRRHILEKYEGVEVQHSYLDEAGQVWDCIPIEQQPSLRRSDAGLAKPPELPGAEKAVRDPSRRGVSLEPQLGPEETDRLGNKRSCPPGTIPMRRVTMEEMARFRTLRDFFRKAPDGGRHPRLSGAREAAEAVAATHKYAHAYQSVNNLGGESYVNVWQPSINTGAGQIFSLSQHWYAGGSGSSLQTVECGWQVYPGKYGNGNANLFIYWTADDYKTTGCYNLDCAAFVQTNPKWHLGGYLRPVSTTGGAQYELFFAYYLYQGNWWLYLQGSAGSDTVGYYPTSLFHGGALASKATEIDYGGETVGTTSWPPMGGGAFASKGWQKAAYQRNIYYFPPGSSSAKEASLSGSQPSPSCYTISVSSKGDWNEHFYFGGPGGTSC